MHAGAPGRAAAAGAPGSAPVLHGTWALAAAPLPGAAPVGGRCCWRMARIWLRSASSAICFRVPPTAWRGAPWQPQKSCMQDWIRTRTAAPRPPSAPACRPPPGAGHPGSLRKAACRVAARAARVHWKGTEMQQQPVRTPATSTLGPSGNSETVPCEMHPQKHLTSSVVAMEHVVRSRCARSQDRWERHACGTIAAPRAAAPLRPFG